jgi:hypothetical protein
MVTLTAPRGIKSPNYNPHPGSEWIDRNRANLPDNSWVAADASGQVALEASINSLFGKLRDKNIDPADVAIAFITQDSA